MRSNLDNYHSHYELHSQNSGLDAELDHTHRRRGGKCCFGGCCFGCLLVLLLFALAVFATWYCFFSGGASLIVSPETTVITEPLKSDGKTVDFHLAIQKMIEPPNVQADENGFRDVLLGYGQQVFESDNNKARANGQYRILCDRWGIDQTAVPQFILKDIHDPKMVDHKGLDAVQVAAAKPYYFIPLVRENEVNLVAGAQPFAAYEFHKTLSDVLRERADARFKAKDIDDAWNDVLTSLRLFRHVTINQAWLEALGGKDNESLLAPDADVVNSLPEWTPEQLERAIKDLESLPNWQDRQTTLTMIQFMLLDILSASDDIVELSNRLGLVLPADVQDILPGLQFIGFDRNLIAKEINQRINAYRDILKDGVEDDKQIERLHLRQPGESFDALLNLDNHFQGLLNDRFAKDGDMSLNPIFASGRSKLAGIIAGELVTKVAGEMYRLQLMEEERCRLLRLELELEAYLREHQETPDSQE